MSGAHAALAQRRPRTGGANAARPPALVWRLPAVDQVAEPAARPMRDLSTVPLHTGGPPTGGDVVVAAPGERCEREADDIAAVVSRARADGISSPSATGPHRVLPVAPQARRHVREAHSGGRLLSAAEWEYFAPRFAGDLRHVRVHDDARADVAARSVGATAYTLGNHVVLRAGVYTPGSPAGIRLLAHELAHTLQARGSSPQVLRRQVAPTSPSPAVDAGPEESTQADELGQAGLVALGSLLQGGIANETELLRTLYNAGTTRIAQEELRLMAEVAAGRLPANEVARRLADMRHELGLDVRRTGSALHRQFAELFDRIRGNAGRPTYETLRAAGKTDLQIIRSAARTNAFVNSLPSRMRWAGRGLWFVSAGISVFVVIDAPPDQRGEVAQDEVEGIIGGVGGTAVGTGICVATGVATGGLGLVVCGLLGGLLGATAARRVDLLELLDIAPHHQPGKEGTFYVVEGEWDVTDLFVVGWVNREVRRSEGVVVVSTGRVSGSMMSGRYGHYRSEEVRPANAAAVALFGGTEPRWVRQGLLVPARLADLVSPEDARTGGRTR